MVPKQPQLINMWKSTSFAESMIFLVWIITGHILTCNWSQFVQLY